MVLLAACSGGGGGGGGLDEEPLGAGEQAVQFAGDANLRLSGTFTVPASSGRGAASGGDLPAVLFVPTLGPGDRDGPIGAGGVPDRIYADLSKELVGQGFATFRYDRRGTGRSTLDPGGPGIFSLDDLVADARAGVDFLSERAGIDADRLAVVAFDDAGLVAVRMVADDARVSRIVLLSSPGRPLADVLADRVAASFGPGSAAALRELAGRLVTSTTLPPAGTIPAELRQYFTTAPAFLAQVLAVDPAVDAARLRVPVLVVVSGVTPGVSKVDADRLAAAIGPGAEVVVTPTAGPTLQTETRTRVVDGSDPAAGTGHEHDASVIPSALSPRERPIVERILSWLGASAG